jgi:hypothetical protein
MTLRRRQECCNSTIVRAEAVRDAFQHPGSVALIKPSRRIGEESPHRGVA